MKQGLIAAVVVGVCWGGAIWYWRATNRQPEAVDLFLFLLVLPLALLIALWLGRVLLAMLLAAPVAASASAAPGTPVAPPAPPPLALTVVGAAVRTPQCGAVDELAAALADNAARPELDAELLDDDGYPVLTARSAAAADPALKEDMVVWLSRNGLPELRYSDEQWRALTLGTAVVAELAEKAVAHRMLAEPALRSNLPALHLMPVWPAGWQGEQRRGAGLWLRHIISEAGWPLERINIGADLPPDSPAASPGGMLARLVQHGAVEGAPLLAIVLACASNIGDATVQRWLSEESLFTSNQPQGRIPGEGAAALLLADAVQAAQISEDPLPTLYFAEAVRENVDNKRNDSTQLRAVADKALGYAGLEPAHVGLVLADTGHTTARVMELMAVSTAALPHLDAATDVLRVGGCSGSCGAVPYLSALAVASAQATERQANVLCLSNEDPSRRSAALIRPAVLLT